MERQAETRGKSLGRKRGKMSSAKDLRLENGAMGNVCCIYIYHITSLCIHLDHAYFSSTLPAAYTHCLL